jgi:CBS domain-containing protein
MTKDPKCVRVDTPLNISFGYMRLGKFRHLIVVDEKGKCAGMLSMKDAFNYICDILTD